MEDLNRRAAGVRRQLNDLSHELISRQSSMPHLMGSQRSSVDWKIADESMCDISVLEYERERMTQLEHRIREKDQVIEDMSELQRELNETIDDLNSKVRRLQVESSQSKRQYDLPSPDFEALQRNYTAVAEENSVLRENLDRLAAQLTMRSRDSQLVRKLQGLIVEACYLDKPPCHRKVWRWVRHLMEDYAVLKKASM
jgi:chromosome segregation ATPase